MSSLERHRSGEIDLNIPWTFLSFFLSSCRVLTVGLGLMSNLYHVSGLLMTCGPWFKLTASHAGYMVNEERGQAYSVMLPRRIGVLRLATHLGHLLCLFCAFSVAVYLRFTSGLFVIRDQPHLPSYAAYAFLAAACWSLAARACGVDELLWHGATLGRWAGAALRATALALGAVTLLAFFYRGYSFSRLTVAMFWTLHTTLVFISGLLLVRLRARLAERRDALQMLVVGRNEFSERVVARLRESGLLAGRPLFVEPSDRAWRERLSSGEWEEVLVALPRSEQAKLEELLEMLRTAQAPVRVALDLPAGEVHRFGEIAVVDLGSSPPDRLSYAVVKRAMDLVIASVLLLLGAPVASLVAFLIKLTSPGPVIFAQARVGANGRSFRMYKFRTLPVQSPEASDRQWSPAAPTGLGRLLRRLRLDEWPQFWNVLRGEMSLVGPRPERGHFAQGFQQVLRDYGLRHRLKAGVTGWAQVHGLTGDTNISLRLQYDLYYLRNWSLALDLRILAMTVAAMLGFPWRPRAAEGQVSDHAESF